LALLLEMLLVALFVFEDALLGFELVFAVVLALLLDMLPALFAVALALLLEMLLAL